MLRARFLIQGLLIILSIVHTRFLATTWPKPWLAVAAVDSVSRVAPLLQGVCAFSFASVVAMIIVMLVRHQFLAALSSAVLVGIGVFGYAALPLAKVFTPTAAAWVASVVGVVSAAVLVWFSQPKASGTRLVISGAAAQRGQGRMPKQLSFLMLFALVYNLLLVIAPSCVVFPTGYAGGTSWAADTLILRHEDSVSIHNNLLFIALRSVIDPVIGSSIIGNSLVTVLMTSIGIALMLTGLQLVTGSLIAIAAALLIVSEHWVMVTAFAGNLPASLVTTCGALFFIVMRVGFDPAPRRFAWHCITFVSLVTATLLSLYSYAAVRMPFVLSVMLLTLIYALRREGSVFKRAFGAAFWVVFPVLAGFAIMVIGPYRGSLASLQHDLFVSWPPESIVPHPGSGEIKNYQVVRNFDVPIWKQVARPMDGSNRSYIWTRTPLEILTALRDHLVEIASNVPELFFLQPFTYVLAFLCLCSLPMVEKRERILIGVVAIWSVIWLSTFLLVPDPNAFRRAVAFPAAFALFAALALLATRRTRVSALLSGVICIVAIVARIPYELALANRTEARMRMFTLCATAPAHRALLKSDLFKDARWKNLIILSAGLNSGREGGCFESAVHSSEWARFVPPTKVIAGGDAKEAAELGADSHTLIIAYCNAESRRSALVEQLCSDAAPSLIKVAQIPNDYDGGYWVAMGSR